MSTENEIVAYRPLALPRPLECHGDALGHVFQAKIGSVECRLRFPDATANSSFDRCEFVPPIQAYPPDGFGEVHKWGSAFQFERDPPKGIHGWEVHAFAIEVTGTENELCRASHEIRKNLREWLELLYEHYDIRTKARSKAIQVESDTFDEVRLFCVGEKQYRIFFEDAPAGMSIQFPPDDIDDVLGLAALSEIVDLTSRDIRLNLENRILLEAYRAFANGDLRRAVIDAATASEVYLNQRISDALPALSSDAVEAILVSLNGLNGKIRFARTLGISLPPDSEIGSSGLLKARNRGLHGGRIPSPTEVRTALAMAENILDVSSGNQTEPVNES